MIGCILFYIIGVVSGFGIVQLIYQSDFNYRNQMEFDHLDILLKEREKLWKNH